MSREDIPQQKQILMDSHVEQYGYRPLYQIDNTVYVRPLPEWLKFDEETEE